MKTLLVRTLDQWRDWLTEHHASASEVWLIFHKRHTGVASTFSRPEGLPLTIASAIVTGADDTSP